MQLLSDVFKKLIKTSRMKSESQLDLSQVQNISAKTSLSAEAEVNFIKTLLERKFNRKFQIRVKAEGYLGENDMKYTMVIDDFCNDNSTFDHHSIYGYSTRDILDVRHMFLKAYWSHVEEGIKSIGKKLDKWDDDKVKRYRDVSVVKSREELLIRADLEGVA